MSQLQSALWLAERGMHVFPVDHPSHPKCIGVPTAHPDPDTCTERGKHPTGKWSVLSTINPAEIAGYFGNGARNIGIACKPSGLLVVDEDAPDAVANYASSVGQVVPVTFTVRTGKGRHYYYRAVDGLELGNAEGLLKGRNINIRGGGGVAGGYVVGPGSLHASGATYQVATDAPIADLPAWLVEALTTARPAQASGSGAPVGSEHWWRDGEIPVGQHHAALVAAAGWCRRMGLSIEEAWPTVRDVWFRLSDGPGRYTEEQAYTELTDIYGRYAEGDRLAQRREWDRLAGTAGVLEAPDETGYVPGSPAWLAAQATVEDVAPASTFDRDVAEELRKLRARAEAARLLKAETAVVTNWAAQILDEDQLDELPDAQPLISGWLDRDSFARIIGRSGSLKSFVAVDLAVCISSGHAWHGHEVSRGSVLYVVGEGAAGIRKRIRAARERYGLERGGIRIIRRPVQLGGAEWDSFVAHLRAVAEQVRPALIIFDTQARMSIGLNENEAKDQSIIVGACDTLRVATGACVSLVHHTGLSDANRGRGITTIYDALDAEILVKRTGMQVTLSTNKQKDDRDDRDLLLTAKSVPVGEPALRKDPANPFTSVLEQETTLVLVSDRDQDASGYGVEAAVVTTRETGHDHLALLVAILREDFSAGNGGTKAEAKSAFVNHETFAPPRGADADEKRRAADRARRAFSRTWGALEGLWRIAVNPDVSRHYRFAEVEGLWDFEANPEKNSDFGWPIAEVGSTSERPKKSGA